MPARYLTLIAVLFLVPVCAHAQRGSATLQATVARGSPVRARHILDLVAASELAHSYRARAPPA